MNKHDSRRTFITTGSRFACALLAAALAGACGQDAALTPVGAEPNLASVTTLASVSPDSALAGSAGVTLTLSGRQFERGSVVRWNGADLPTTFVSKWSLKATVDASRLVAGGAYDVAVFTPGDGITPAQTFTVYHAVPTLARVTPDSVAEGQGARTVAVEGTGFAPASVVRWDGADRPTTFVSATRLEVSLAAADLATAGQHEVRVFNPAPGGGVSNADTFRVTAPRPVIAGLHAYGATAGGGGFILTVTGADFRAGTTVRWNGADLPTTYVSATRLTASVSAGDVAAAGTAEITAFTAGGGASAPVAFAVRSVGAATVAAQTILPLSVRDLVYNPRDGKIYASVYAGAGANSIAVIDPATGVLEDTVWVGSGPGVLALSDDGTTLYVGLDGASAVRRFDTVTRTAGMQFGVGSGYYGPHRAEDISVMPGRPDVIAVSRRNSCCSPRHEGVAVYENGVERSLTTARHTGSNVITFGGAPSALYGFNNESTEFGFRRMQVGDAGVQTTDVTTGLMAYFYTDIVFAAGRVYGTTGAILDPDTRSRVGTCAVSGGVAADAETGRAFFLKESGIGVCDVNTYRTLGTIPVPYLWFEHPANVRVHLVRWGADGLAYHDEDQLFIVRSPVAAR